MLFVLLFPCDCACCLPSLLELALLSPRNCVCTCLLTVSFVLAFVFHLFMPLCYTCFACVWRGEFLKSQVVVNSLDGDTEGPLGKLGAFGAIRALGALGR